MSWFGGYNYLIYITLLVIGLYTIMAKPNLVKKVIGLGLFQTGVFLFFISSATVDGGTAPIMSAGTERYANPLPHVLILTAIVVSVSTTAVALALCIRIHEAYGTIEAGEIRRKDLG